MASKRKTAADELDQLLNAINSCPPASSQSEAATLSSAAPFQAPLLRQLISRPRVGVGCLIRCPELHPGCILIGERAGSHGAGKWALPGGHMEGLIFLDGYALKFSSTRHELINHHMALAIWRFPGQSASFGHTACEELKEECNLDLEPSSFSVVTVTNDPMPDESLHYITIFVTAEISAAQAARIENMEPNKCSGWEWLTWQQVEQKQLFIPMQHLLQQGGERLLTQHLASLQHSGAHQ
jgi:8-oxo-dGTP diphosphatase